MAQGIQVILCASGVETDNFVTEVGTNLFDSGSSMAQWVVDQLGGKGTIVQMNGIPGVDTAGIMAQGATWSGRRTPISRCWTRSTATGRRPRPRRLPSQWIAQYSESIQAIWFRRRADVAGHYRGVPGGRAANPTAAASSEYSNGFLRLAKENNLEFAGWQYPNAMSIICIDEAIKVLKGEPVKRFVDFKDVLPETATLNSEDIDKLYNPNWSDDVFGPIFLSEAKMKELGYQK